MPAFQQFVRYILVGGIAFVVDFTMLYLLTDKFGLHYLVSATFAFTFGLIVNYALCITWIFDVRAISHRGHEFAIFGIIGTAGLLLNNGLMYILTEALGRHYLYSKIIAAGAILIFNFAFRRSILFTERKQRVRQTAEGTKS